MPAALSKELVATVLVEAMYSTDEMACSRYDISEASLRRYRQSLPDDPELSGIVATKKQAFDTAWADRVPRTLVRAFDAIHECIEAMQGDAEKKKDPAVLQAIVGAAKICAEISVTGRFIDARIGKPDHSASGLSRPSTPENGSAYSN